MKFKVGDKVRIVKYNLADEDKHFYLKEGTVIGVNNDIPWPIIVDIPNIPPNGFISEGSLWAEYELELLSE